MRSTASSMIVSRFARSFRIRVSIAGPIRVITTSPPVRLGFRFTATMVPDRLAVVPGVAAALSVRGRRDAVFLIAGDGARLDALRAWLTVAGETVVRDQGTEIWAPPTADARRTTPPPRRAPGATAPCPRRLPSQPTPTPFERPSPDGRRWGG